VEITENAKQLPAYKHPHQACYLLGAEDYGLSPEIIKKCHDIVQIPYSFSCLNVAVAGSIVFYDRSMKCQKSIEFSGVTAQP